MKPHIPLILIPVLLATAPAKEGYHAYMETDAQTDAFIPLDITYTEYAAGVYSKKHVYPVDGIDTVYFPVDTEIKRQSIFLSQTSFFNKAGTTIRILDDCVLDSEEGSIVLENITLKTSALLLKETCVYSEKWGLPQIALRNVNFLPVGLPRGDENWMTTEFASNYTTVSEWNAEDCDIEISRGGATFTSGRVSGIVVMDAAGTIKLDGIEVTDGASLVLNAKDTVYLAAKAVEAGQGNGVLTINASHKVTIGENHAIGEAPHVMAGNVVVNYTGTGGQDNWDVDVLCKVNGSLKVNAANARVNAGILSGAGEVTAKQVYVSSFEGSSLDLTSGSSVMLKGNVQATDRLTVSELGYDYAEITFDGAVLNAENRISMAGKTITGSDADALISSRDVMLNAKAAIDVAGAFQVQKLSLMAPTGSIAIGSFQGETIDALAGKALEVKGNVASTGAVAAGKHAVALEGSSITIDGSVTAANGGVSLKSTESDINISGALTAAVASTLTSGRDITVVGKVQASVTATAAYAINLRDDAELSDSAIHAPVVSLRGMTASKLQLDGGMDTIMAQVTHSDKLSLTNNSRIVGNVVCTTPNRADVSIVSSTVTGTVENAGTLELSAGIIGSAKDVSTLRSSGISQITAQGEGGLTIDNLVLGGGSLTLGTQESHNENLTLNRLLVDAATVLNANLAARDGAVLEFGENAVVTLGCTVTFLGEASFITPAEGLLMDSVEDVLDADGKSITLSWDQSAGMQRWHKELYKVGDKTYTTDASAAGATLTNLSLVYERTYSDTGPFNGTIRIAALPEPATGTLGLLALASLAARRRKRHANLISNK